MAEHFNAGVQIKQVTPAEPGRNQGYGQGSIVAPKERQVTDLLTINVNGDTLDEVIDKLIGHLRLHKTIPQ